MVPSREHLAEYLSECYDHSRGQPIDITDADYAGCVYVLECGMRSAGEAEYLSILDHRKTSVPWWIAPAREARTRLYVGRAMHLECRLWEHIRGARSGGAHFTDIFRPEQLRRMSLYDRYTERDARRDASR